MFRLDAREIHFVQIMNINTSFIELETGNGISLHDLTADIRDTVAGSGIQNGFVTVTSQHTTTAITINEYEERLLEDVKTFLARLIPPGDSYLHNDIHLRDCPPDEPENAHSHLAAMLLGSSEVIALADGGLVLGQYQSLMLVELDGPRTRRVSVQVVGE
jgi:secondary thiamine-phosphate synthase enzyme